MQLVLSYNVYSRHTISVHYILFYGILVLAGRHIMWIQIQEMSTCICSSCQKINKSYVHSDHYGEHLKFSN